MTVSTHNPPFIQCIKISKHCTSHFQCFSIDAFSANVDAEVTQVAGERQSCLIPFRKLRTLLKSLVNFWQKLPLHNSAHTILSWRVHPSVSGSNGCGTYHYRRFSRRNLRAALAISCWIRIRTSTAIMFGTTACRRQEDSPFATCGLSAVDYPTMLWQNWDYCTFGSTA